MIEAGLVTEKVEVLKAFRIELDEEDGLTFADALAELLSKNLQKTLIEEQEEVLVKVYSTMVAAVNELTKENNE